MQGRCLRAAGWGLQGHGQVPRGGFELAASPGIDQGLSEGLCEPCMGADEALPTLPILGGIRAGRERCSVPPLQAGAQGMPWEAGGCLWALCEAIRVLLELSPACGVVSRLQASPWAAGC